MIRVPKRHIIILAVVFCYLTGFHSSFVAVISYDIFTSVDEME